PHFDPALIQSSITSETGYFIKEVQGKTYFVAYNRSSATGWTYLNVTPFNQIFRQIVLIKEIVIGVFILIFAFAILWGIRFSRGLTRPIENLIARMKLAEKGNFAEANILAGDQEPPAMDELGLLHRTFRLMVERINDLITENYASRLLIKETEFKALQAQINPHFLYNTLESINWMAKINKQTQISQMVQALAFLLRNSVSLKEPILTLKEELEMVQHYITIQKFRFEERLSFHMDVPEREHFRKIPKLTLQPLLENAIHYALEPSVGTCTISLTSREEADAFILIVEDDGPGMASDTLELLREGRLTTAGNGIGLLNIDERIRFAFGENYGLFIDSAPDDERIILDGISQMVDWQDFGTELTGTAQNGLQAYDLIAADPPDIVISDIRMPGLDGLGLVAQTYATHPNVKFVLLSGFGEFEYANRAMQYGVKHYLLKPTDETKIAEALKEVTAELDQKRRREAFILDMKRRFEKVIPHVKEQVLREFGEADYEHQFAVKNIAEDLLQTALMSTTLGDHALILISDPEDQELLHSRLQDIRRTFRLYYKMNVTVAVSDPGPITSARKMYRETLQCLNYRFYLDESGIITRKDTFVPDGGVSEFAFDEERLMLPVRSGDREEASLALSEFIAELKRAQLSIEMTKSYAISMYAALVRLDGPERMAEAYKRITEIADMGSLQAIQSFLEETVRDMTRRNYERNAYKYNAIVRKVIDIVEQIGNASLSLNLVAHEMLYMNADYLGKLFKKETGEKFSNYVMRIRIQRATELMAENPDAKIFEMAEQLGFGDNPQYFSQVFKKQMGCTPSEYIRKLTGGISAF
ncbi:hypothetical protein BGX30_002346, partial [Mortierella sp. GBA39]